MSLQWCLQVLAKKGACPEFLARLQNLYSNNYSVVVVNNIPGAAVKNVRLTLRQGDIPSMELFSFGIDPLLCLLERVLQGILICSIPVLGPKPQHGPPPPPVELRYKVIGYADDSKPAITSMQEFTLVDKSLSLFENASGCKVHRDPASMKCKFLPLGRWRNTLEQTDIPCNYMTLADHLDMVGVTLKATWTQTRKVNGDAIQQRVDNTVKPWKAGKFMPITQRSWSLNSFALSKVWFRTRCVPLRECDFKKISSSCKSWLYQDRFAKPEETDSSIAHTIMVAVPYIQSSISPWQASSLPSSKLLQIQSLDRIFSTIFCLESMYLARMSQQLLTHLLHTYLWTCLLSLRKSRRKHPSTSPPWLKRIGQDSLQKTLSL
jgi:hypothetical protein